MRRSDVSSGQRGKFSGWLVLAGASAVAVLGARDFAGGWNDGSRLATVEALVDQHTFIIDHSVFVEIPRGANAPRPYSPGNEHLLLAGTGDKMFIGGHFYSDKSPIPAILMAGAYQCIKAFTGLNAHLRPDLFCYWMTVCSSGLAYVVAVWCVFQIGRAVGLSDWNAAFLATSFGSATLALPYSRHVNNHVLLLGVAAATMLQLRRLASDLQSGRHHWLRFAALGTLAGFGYAIDLGSGPILLACVAAAVCWRCGRVPPVGVVLAAALPWLALHHAFNYAVAGTLIPGGAVPDYFRWPGSTFNPQNMTGVWNHSPGHFLVYAAALLLGKRGFIGHNLPLFLLPVAFGQLLRRGARDLPELAFSGMWCAGTWLIYALTSNNYSGQCCSIRWFVPLLAPAYDVLALLLAAHPRFRGHFAVLTAWGGLLAGMMWIEGPWMSHLVPLFWPIQGAALGTCLLMMRGQRLDPQFAAAPTSAAPRARAA